MPKKIFTFSAVSTTTGDVSVEAETLEEAKELVKKLGEDAVQNIMTGPAGTSLEVDLTSGKENTDADYGSMSYLSTDREIAMENMEKLEEMADDEEDAQ